MTADEGSDPKDEPQGAADHVHVHLPPDTTAPSEARKATTAALQHWKLTSVLDPLLLAVSEIVTNAVRHGRPPVELWLRRSGQGVRVEVHDDNPSPPGGQPALPSDDGAVSGRGRYLVDAVSTGTGVESVPDDGKIVWAVVEPDGTP